MLRGSGNSEFVKLLSDCHHDSRRTLRLKKNLIHSKYLYPVVSFSLLQFTLPYHHVLTLMLQDISQPVFYLSVSREVVQLETLALQISVWINTAKALRTPGNLRNLTFLYLKII